MKFFLSIIALFFSFLSFSQRWLDSLPKSRSEYTFYDYQDAFNKYWSPFNVKNGYYYQDGVKKKAYGWKQFKRWEYQMNFQLDRQTGKILLSEGNFAHYGYEFSKSMNLLRSGDTEYEFPLNKIIVEKLNSCKCVGTGNNKIYTAIFPYNY